MAGRPAKTLDQLLGRSDRQVGAARALMSALGKPTDLYRTALNDPAWAFAEAAAEIELLRNALDVATRREGQPR